MRPTRTERRRAARRIATRFGVPFAVAARTVEHVVAGRATSELADLVPELPSVPVTFRPLEDE